MICCGKWFGCLHLDLPGIVMMLAAVAAVYYVVNLRDANIINKRLKEKHRDGELQKYRWW